MAKGLLRHYRSTFYRLPPEIDGYKPWPMMITITQFAEDHHYNKAQLLTLLRDGHLYGKTFKKNLFVCPCPLSHLWTPEVIEQFWRKV
jgi:hypothetical protein